MVLHTDASYHPDFKEAGGGFVLYGSGGKVSLSHGFAISLPAPSLVPSTSDPNTSETVFYFEMMAAYMSLGFVMKQLTPKLEDLILVSDSISLVKALQGEVFISDYLSESFVLEHINILLGLMTNLSRLNHYSVKYVPREQNFLADYLAGVGRRQYVVSRGSVDQLSGYPSSMFRGPKEHPLFKNYFEYDVSSYIATAILSEGDSIINKFKDSYDIEFLLDCSDRDPPHENVYLIVYTTYAAHVEVDPMILEIVNSGGHLKTNSLRRNASFISSSEVDDLGCAGNDMGDAVIRHQNANFISSSEDDPGNAGNDPGDAGKKHQKANSSSSLKDDDPVGAGNDPGGAGTNT